MAAPEVIFSLVDRFQRMTDASDKKIDKLVYQLYGLTEEELDFIINYDIKYRMGKELEED